VNVTKTQVTLEYLGSMIACFTVTELVYLEEFFCTKSMISCGSTSS